MPAASQIPHSAYSLCAQTLSGSGIRYANQGELKSLDPYTLKETTTIAHHAHVYEGLTSYLGPVLTARSGLLKPEQSRRHLAQIAAGDNASPVAPGNMLGRYNFDAPPGGLMLTLTWPIGTLQSAPAINGPWTNVGVTSPYIIISPTGPLFYRLKL